MFSVMHENNRRVINFIFLLIFMLSQTAGFTQQTWMPALFADGMILQRDKLIPFWGTTVPGENVTIVFNKEKRSAKADAKGNWRIDLQKRKAGGPFEIFILSKDTIRFKDVWIGDVWIASGQSNMEMPVAPNPWFAGVKDYAAVINHSTDPLLRVFTVVKNSQADMIQKDVAGQWLQASKENTGSFTGVGYFFAKNLRRELDVPVGIISTSWGASSAQAWVKKDVLQEDPSLRSIAEEWQQVYEKYKTQSVIFEKDSVAGSRTNAVVDSNKLKHPSIPWMAQKRPSALFNGMIAPLVPYGIKGVIWYQGEGNAEKPRQYDTLFPALITNWRNEWQQLNLPFLLVQLPGFKQPQQQPVEEGWPFIRESQAKATALPNVGMVVTIDLGEENDIHPKNKQDVGLRLARYALGKVYGSAVEYSGPRYRKMSVDGGRCILEFDTKSALRIKDGDELKGFAIAGADQQFVWATAKIIHRKVIVYSSAIKEPVAVRYNWANNPVGNLYNKEFPAAPFRTDNWIK